MPTFTLFLYFVFFLFSVISLGAFLLNRIRFSTDNEIEFLTYAFGVGAALHGMLFVYLGMFHVLYPSTVFIGYAVSALIGVVGLTQQSWQRAIQRTLASIPPLFQNVYVLSLLVLFFFVFFPLIPHLFLYVISWDATAYHLLLPKFYLQQHTIDFVGWFPHSAFPMAVHALFGFGEALRETRMSNFITFAFTFMAGLYMLFGLRKRFPQIVLALSFFLFFFQPQLYSEIGYSPNVDYALAFFSILAGVTLLKYIEKPQVNTAWVLFTLAFFTGFIKVSGLFVTGVIGLAFLITTFFALRALKKNTVQKWLTKNWLALGAFFLVLFPCIFWYGKTWVQAGNPIYPFMNNVFKGYDYDPSAVDLLKDDINLLNSYVQPIVLRYRTATDTAADSARFSELVLLVFTAGFGVLTLLVGKKQERILAAVGLTVLVPVIYLVGPLLRYYMCAIPLIIVANVSVVYRLLTTSRQQKVLLFPLLSAGSLLLIFSIETTYLPRQLLFLNIPKRMLLSYLDPKVAHDKLYLQDNYRTIEYANTHLNPQKDKVLLVGDNRMYYLDIPAELANPSLHGYFVDKSITTPEGVYQKLKANGFTHAMVSGNWGVAPNTQKKLYYDFWYSNLVEVMATQSGNTLYRLK